MWSCPDIEKFSALLALFMVTGEFPSEWDNNPELQFSFFAIRLHKRLNKQSIYRWFGMPWVWRDVTVILFQILWWPPAWCPSRPAASVPWSQSPQASSSAPEVLTLSSPIMDRPCRSISARGPRVSLVKTKGHVIWIIVFMWVKIWGFLTNWSYRYCMKSHGVDLSQGPVPLRLKMS